MTKWVEVTAEQWADALTNNDPRLKGLYATGVRTLKNDVMIHKTPDGTEYGKVVYPDEGKRQYYLSKELVTFQRRTP